MGEGIPRGLVVDPRDAETEIFQLPACFRQIVGFQALLDLLAMDLDNRVVCFARGVAVEAFPDFFKCNL